MVFRYKVLFYFDDDEKIEIGLIVADSYTDAATKITNVYGEDLLSIEKLKQISHREEVIVFPSDEESVIDKIEDDYIW